MAFVLTSTDKRVMVGLPIDDRAVLSATQREELMLVRKYKWMLVTDTTTGKMWQLQPPTGGDVNTHVMLWVWRLIDSSAILTEDLTAYGDLGGIVDQTLYEAGTPLEDIIRDLLSQERSPVLPTISLANLSFVEKGSSGSQGLSLTQILNDTPAWNGNPRYYANNVATVNPHPYTNIQSNISFRAERDYLACPDSPELTNGFAAGTAYASPKVLTVTLPFFYGNGNSENWHPDTIDEAWIQSHLDNNLLSYKRRLVDIVTNQIPTTTINIEFGLWNNGIDYYRWIMIPKAWNKIIERFTANSFDFGVMGEDPFITVLDVVIDDPLGRWSGEEYTIYCTAAKLEFMYFETELFYFTLNNN